MLFQTVAIVALVTSSTLAAPHPGGTRSDLQNIRQDQMHLQQAIATGNYRAAQQDMRNLSQDRRRYKRSHHGSHGGNRHGNRKHRQQASTATSESEESTVQERDIEDEFELVARSPLSVESVNKWANRVHRGAEAIKAGYKAYKGGKGGKSGKGRKRDLDEMNIEARDSLIAIDELD